MTIVKCKASNEIFTNKYWFQNQGDLAKPIHVVVSLGTGCIPQEAVKHCDVYRPEGLFDIAKVAFGATALGQILIDQVNDQNIS